MKIFADCLKLHKEHAGFAVELRQAHLHKLAAGGGDVLAHKVRPNGQLSVAPVYQRRKLDSAGSAAGEHRLDSGAGGSARVQHVVHKDHIPVGDGAGQLRFFDHGAFGKLRQVVPVELDIDTAAGRLKPLDFADVLPDAPGDWLTPAADAHQHHIFRALVLLHDLVGDAHKRAAQRRLVHYLCFELHRAALPFFISE